MSGIRDQENIDELRKRLYERGTDPSHTERHKLLRPDISVSRGWEGVGAESRMAGAVVGEGQGVSANFTAPIEKPKRRYRLVILLASMIFFIVTVAGASLYLYFGANQISASNITITVNTPIAIAGGDVLPLQINVSNQNSVPINDAVLIINYPSGTRSTDESARELFEERISLGTVAPGQAKNIPVRAVLFGEENQEKEIKVAVEYKVEGSNGAFFKEAPVQIIKISSSPLVVRVSGVKTVSSGQQVEIKLELQSNSPTTQRNILINASYPSSFSFVSANPKPAYNQNSWLIPELAPESTYEITVRGTVQGQTSEVSLIQMQAGNPQIGNQFLMDSVLAQASHTYVVEQPFTSVVVSINDDKDGEAILEAGEDAMVIMTVTNTLSESIYDMRVEILPRGNLIRDNNLQTDSARSFYEESTRTIRYDVAGDSSLEQIGPGESRSFTFSVRADPLQQTGSFSISSNIFARRVTERQAAETLIGTALAEAKYSGSVSLGSQTQYTGLSSVNSTTGPTVIDSGPIPPVAGLATTYTVVLQATAGVNDLTGAVVTASLPQSVDFTNVSSGEGALEFNPITKQIRWNAGDIKAKGKKTLYFQVSLLPSVTAIGREAVLVGAQSLRASDRFTGIPLTADGPDIYNTLSTEFGFVPGNGIIRAE